MNKIYSILDIYFISSIIGILCEIFFNIKISFTILLILIIIDTFTGTACSIKLKRFNSRGCSKFVKKVIVYSLSLISVRLLEMGIIPLVKTTLLSQIMVSYLEITECISILENLAVLGAPLPSDFILFLISNLKIPGLVNILKMSKNTQKDVTEIDEIIKYQISEFNDKYIKRLLEIKFSIWESIIQQIHIILGNDSTDNNDLIYYRIMSLVESGFKEMNDAWKREGIPDDYIKRFTKSHQQRVDKWFVKLRKICYSNNTIQSKKEEIIDSIIVILYQTILDAHKVYDKEK